MLKCFDCFELTPIATAWERDGHKICPECARALVNRAHNEAVHGPHHDPRNPSPGCKVCGSQRVVLVRTSLADQGTCFSCIEKAKPADDLQGLLERPGHCPSCGEPNNNGEEGECMGCAQGAVS